MSSTEKDGEPAADSRYEALTDVHAELVRLKYDPTILATFDPLVQHGYKRGLSRAISVVLQARNALPDDTRCPHCGLMFHGAKGYCDWCGKSAAGSSSSVRFGVGL